LTEFRMPPAASIRSARPSRSIVGVALGWMKCVQIVLYAAGSGRCSTRATRAPARPSSVAAVQPATLAPTTTTS